MAHPLWVLAFAVLGGGDPRLAGGDRRHLGRQVRPARGLPELPHHAAHDSCRGVFYSIHSLPPFWQDVSHFNPFFYMIDGFRYGFFGQSDTSPWLSLGVVGLCFVLLAALTLAMLARGYKLRS
jgi:ABC-2 type transport system permease protein